ncbi:phasin family protein [Brevundimonas sp. AAP58]|uniref:phasin family protein n=1 Tax=Brevundimonas sp. AAP58 TaxID=1523422 RepID=UPI0009E9782E|nr:phasin family protein [Brevundimonas sp. AAP58]
MTKTTKVGRATRKVTATAEGAATHAANGADMMRAASEVIAARITILADGLADPMKADIREMSLMGTEKLEAMGASATALAGAMGDLTARVSASAMEEMGHAASAASAMAAAKTPQAALLAQMSWAMGWWSRASSQALSVNAELLKAQSEALKPIHAAATANARRLRK